MGLGGMGHGPIGGKRREWKNNKHGVGETVVTFLFATWCCYDTAPAALDTLECFHSLLSLAIFVLDLLFP